MSVLNDNQFIDIVILVLFLKFFLLSNILVNTLKLITKEQFKIQINGEELNYSVRNLEIVQLPHADFVPV